QMSVDYTVTYVSGERVTGNMTLGNGAPAGSALVSSVVINGTAPTVGGVVQFGATATRSNGASEDVTGRAAWTSSNTAVASVSSGGAVTGVAAGQASIAATFEGVTGTLPITVIGSSSGTPVNMV